MPLPSDRTNLQAAAGNQVPNHLLASALNIGAMTTAYDTIDELYSFTAGILNTGTIYNLGIANATDSIYGAKGDGVTDDTAAIQAALSSGKSVLLPSGLNYKISNTLTVPDGVALFTTGGIATITMTTKDIPAISIGGQSTLENLQINLPGSHTVDTGCGVRPRLITSGDNTSYFTMINVYIKGTDFTGNGIYIAGSSGSLSFSRIVSCKFNRVLNAFKSNTTSPAYCNGFVFSDSVCNTSTRFLYLTGYGSGGHIIDNLEWNQNSSTTEIFWFDSSNDNNIRGYFYDVGQYGSTSIIMKCTGTSQGNVIHTALDVGVSTSNITDTTTNKLNYLNFDRRKFSNVLNQFMNLPSGYMDFTGGINTVGYWSKTKPYGGWIENSLAYSDKIHTVTTTPAPTANPIGNCFDPSAQIHVAKPTWTLTGSNTAVIQIDFNLTLLSTTSKRMDYFSIFFGNGNYAQSILVEAWDRSLAAWQTVLNTTTNTLQNVFVTGDRDGKTFGTDIQKIKVTLSVPAATNVEVEQIHVRLLSNMGLAYMPRGGGQIFGDLNMDAYYMTVGKVASLPTAAVAYRGKVIRVEGGAGVADNYYMCMKSAADTYSWKVIATG